jgi:hypothetical protein
MVSKIAHALDNEFVKSSQNELEKGHIFLPLSEPDNSSRTEIALSDFQAATLGRFTSISESC